MPDQPVHYQTDQRPRPELLIPERDEHVWIAAAVFRVTPESLREQGPRAVNMDRENLATIEVGCFVCEQPYSDRLSYRRCPGDPRTA